MDKDFDHVLNIKTDNIRDWGMFSYHYHRLEPTSYKVLQQIFNNIDLNSKDQLVDFGCGNGRVLFFVHYYFNINVTGIEFHPQTYTELLDNKRHYLNKNSETYNKIATYNVKAEEYSINQDDSVFYFFNPFSVYIYKKVISNILQSLNEFNRKVQLIIYYPTTPLIDFLNLHTPFNLYRKIEVSWTFDKMDHVLIYKN